MTRLEPGFYPHVDGDTGYQNPTEGGLDWSGGVTGSGVAYTCGNLTGWLAVDEVVYAADGTVERLVARFEQSCGNRFSGYRPPLRGYLRWEPRG